VPEHTAPPRFTPDGRSVVLVPETPHLGAWVLRVPVEPFTGSAAEASDRARLLAGVGLDDARRPLPPPPPARGGPPAAPPARPGPAGGAARRLAPGAGGRVPLAQLGRRGVPPAAGHCVRGRRARGVCGSGPGLPAPPPVGRRPRRLDAGRGPGRRGLAR